MAANMPYIIREQLVNFRFSIIQFGEVKTNLIKIETANNFRICCVQNTRFLSAKTFILGNAGASTQGYI